MTVVAVVRFYQLRTVKSVKNCGIASHRSNCNTWFETVKKHHYCGGCAYDFKPTD